MIGQQHSANTIRTDGKDTICTGNGKQRKPLPRLDMSKFQGVDAEPAEPQQPVSEIIQKCQAAKVDLLKDALEPQNILDIKCSLHYSRFATLGNFSLVIGKAKSRKTFFISLLVAAFVGGSLLMDKLQAWLKPGKNKILWFDSEQGEYHVQRSYRCALATIHPRTGGDNLEVYALRRYDTKTRLEMIEHLIYNTEGVAVVIIDGVRDIVTDINSPEEATMVSNKLLKWTEERNIHIITVLHQNKADNNARGHVGTELINKAESVLSIAKDQDNSELSIVTPEYFRDKEFKPFAFGISEQGLPYIVEDWIGKAAKEPKKGKSATHIDDEFHKARIRDAWRIDDNPTYGFAWRNIKVAFEKHQRLNDNEAKDFLAWYQKEGWVCKIDPPESGKKFATYKINFPV